jgi:hypothetical protein
MPLDGIRRLRCSRDGVAPVCCMCMYRVGWIVGFGLARALGGLAKVALPLLWAMSQGSGIAEREAQVTEPTACQPAAVALARLCQSDQAFFRDEEGVLPAWAPAEVLRLNPASVEIAPEGATVEFGGGFHHFGYRLKRDAQSASDEENAWTLYFYCEADGESPLHKFALAKSERVELKEFIDGTMREFERRSADGANDRDVRERVRFLLKHCQTQRARDSIHQYAARDPHDWLDQTLAFLIDQPGDPSAGARLEAWAAGQADFTGWLFAAYAHDAAGDGDSAERCVTRALEHKPNDPPGSGSNARHRGAPMCVALYRAGRYRTCMSLCDALLSYPGSGDYREAELLKTYNLAQQATSQPPDKEAAPTLDEPFDPFEGIDLDALKHAPSPASRSQDAMCSD